MPIARPWIRASALGWTLGLLFAHAGVALTPATATGARELVILAVCGAAMAVVPAAITGLALQRLAARRP